MPDPAGFVQNQKRGDLQVFDGIGWRASTQTTVGVALSSPGAKRELAPGSGLGLLAGGRLNIYDGSLASPVTTDFPSIVIGRVSSFSAAPAFDNAIAVQSIGNASAGGITNVAIRGYAFQLGKGDTVGVSGEATVDSGATGTPSAIGLYAAASDFSGVGLTVGLNTANQVIANSPTWSSPGISGSFGVYAQALALPGHTGHNYSVTAAFNAVGDGTDASFDNAFIASHGVTVAAFRDETNATTSVLIHGSHTDGIDLSAGTYSGSQVKLKGGVAYTPTVSPGAGAFTTVTASGHYILLGKLLYFSLVITQTNIGTGSGTITFPLPLSLTSRDGTSLSGYGTVNKGLQCQIATGSGTVTLMYYDGTSAIQNGNFLVVSGFVEVA